MKRRRWIPVGLLLLGGGVASVIFLQTGEELIIDPGTNALKFALLGNDERGRKQVCEALQKIDPRLVGNLDLPQAK